MTDLASGFFQLEDDPVRADLRPLALAHFANEGVSAPSKQELLSWAQVLDLHRNRDIRPIKSGPMIGGYELNDNRKDDNVLHRSFLQLDIDSTGNKDKATGRLLEVTRTAPELDDIRSAIEQYEWFANSTHWHEPARGAIKYRITIQVDRDILKDDHKPLLEALDEIAGGCLDRAAWAWSQAFYLPSCPPKNAEDAFFVHNQGTPLPVDKFVDRGREVLASRKHADGPPADARNPPKPSIPETQDNIQQVETMLASIPAAIDRMQWRSVVWAVRSLGWKTGEQLAHDWSLSAPQKWNETDFLGVWQSFDPNRQNAIGPGTLEHIARSQGYIGPALARKADFDGKGADVFNGKRLAEKHRARLLNIHETGEWFLFDNRVGWITAEPLEQERAAKAVLEDLRQEAAQQLAAGVDEAKVKKLLAHLQYTSRAGNLRAMIDMAKSETGMTRKLADFDADPMLLGVENGVLDLRTGRLLPTSPNLLIRKRCNVSFDPDAKCPKFDQFLFDVQPDHDMRGLLQRLGGYGLTGYTSEQVFTFFHGSGSNGKSVFIETQAALMGDYSQKIATEMLMRHQRNPQGPSPDIVALQGARLVYASETEEGQRLAAARVKELTGGDSLTGRVPHAKAAVTFPPTHKLVVVGNHRPEISDMSHGMWRRVLLVGFDQTIPETQRDPHLAEKLRAELPGILNWFLAGLKEWRRQGLQVPIAVRQATGGYRNEQDIIGEWIIEQCNLAPGSAVPKGTLYLNYKLWASENGYQPLAQHRFTRRLGDRDHKLDAGRRNILGLAVKDMIGGAMV